MKSFYEAVIDAGSSGTRIYLYKVTLARYPVIELISHYEFSRTSSGKKEDGLNNFINPRKKNVVDDACREVIGPLLKSISIDLEKVGVEKGVTTVNLLATAGMRYAEQHFGKESVDHLYTLINKFIYQDGYKAGDIRTSHGSSEEGIWTWVNLNDVYRDIFNDGGTPLGIIEVGGSSLQLSFPSIDASNSKNDIYCVEINNRQFNVFCKTYLGLGQDDARKKMRSSLGPEKSAACFPPGFIAKNDFGDALDGFGTLSLKSDGNYQYQTCNDGYESVIEEIHTSTPLPKLENAEVEFVGIDGIYHALKFWDIEESPEKLKELINSKSLNIQNFMDISENEYTQAQCANATYVNSLLYGRLGLIAKNPKKMICALPNKCKTGKILTWTRGYLLLKYSKHQATLQSQNNEPKEH